MVKDNIISLNFELIIKSKLFIGKKPPEEIIVNDKLNELNVLISAMYKIKKIIIVNNKYTILILKHCFIVLSKISIKSIIDIKKYRPPIHWVDDLHNIRLSSKCLILLNTVNPVDVNPDIASK